MTQRFKKKLCHVNKSLFRGVISISLLRGQACVKGNIQEVHDLILKGADKNAPLDKELKTPFPALAI